ncbi:helix-turn-helix domain-containing protein [Streptomyces cremeus]
MWPGQALYLGPSLNLGFHAGAVSCLAVGVDAGFTLELEDGARLKARTALVGARVRHRIVADGARMAFCYLDPASTRERACHSLMAEDHGEVALGHCHEAELTAVAAGLAPGAPPADLRPWLDLAGPDRLSGRRDPRIRRAADRLADPAEPHLSAAELAADVGLSVSAFLRLFRAQTGTTFRRYRLWARMLRVAVLLETWPDLSTAAVEAGFASPSHFSSTFHGMFGLRPSALFSQRVAVSWAEKPGQVTAQ